MTDEEARKRAEVQETLARARKTIAESSALVEAAHLRVAETDRFLAAQGLTREQVLGFQFTREQKLAVNEELVRRGLPPIEEDDTAYDFAAATASLREDGFDGASAPAGDVVSERSRKFGAFMQQYRL